jgi:hypothetical protein
VDGLVRLDERASDRKLQFREVARRGRMRLPIGEIRFRFADVDAHIARYLCYVPASEIDLDNLAIAVFGVDTVVLAALRSGRHVWETQVRALLEVDRARVISPTVRFKEQLSEEHAR